MPKKKKTSEFPLKVWIIFPSVWLTVASLSIWIVSDIPLICNTLILVFLIVAPCFHLVMLLLVSRTEISLRFKTPLEKKKINYAKHNVPSSPLKLSLLKVSCISIMMWFGSVLNRMEIKDSKQTSVQPSQAVPWRNQNLAIFTLTLWP